MEIQKGSRKSLRNKRKSVFLKDYVQSGVNLNDDLISLDETLSEHSDLEGKYNTLMWLLV